MKGEHVCILRNLNTMLQNNQIPISEQTTKHTSQICQCFMEWLNKSPACYLKIFLLYCTQTFLLLLFLCFLF